MSGVFHETFFHNACAVRMSSPVSVPFQMRTERHTVWLASAFLDVETIQQGLHVESWIIARWHPTLLRKRLPMKRVAQEAPLLTDRSKGVLWLPDWGYRVRRALAASRALVVGS